MESFKTRSRLFSVSFHLLKKFTATGAKINNIVESAMVAFLSRLFSLEVCADC